MLSRWINAVLGIWLLASGLIVGPRATSFPDHLFLGLAIFLVAFIAMAVPGARWVNVALGAWLVLSPFVFKYMDHPMALNDIVVGILVVTFALNAPPHRRAGRARAAA